MCLGVKQPEAYRIAQFNYKFESRIGSFDDCRPIDEVFNAQFVAIQSYNIMTVIQSVVEFI